MSMEKKEVVEQYDRFLDQVREEAKSLSWLYNFFFVIESALIAGVFAGRFNAEYVHFVAVCGLILAIYWFIIVRKQRLWRNYWIRRIQALEKQIGFAPELQMWPERARKPRLFKDYIWGKKGVWRSLFWLPVGFALVWIKLFFSGSGL